MLLNKKRLIGDRLKAVQEQDTAKAQAKTAQLKKDIERTKEVQDAQRHKEVAEVKMKMQTSLAREEAQKEKIVADKQATLLMIKMQSELDLAKKKKQRELDNAKSDKEIAQANADAAVFQAKALLENGLAEAKVKSANYTALQQNKDIYLAEVQRDMSKYMYSAIQNINVQMPQNYIQGDGAGRMTSNVDVITGLASLGMMQQAGAGAPPKSLTKEAGWFGSA